MCQFIETIRIEDGQVYNLSYHTARMNRTRAAFWKEAAPIDLSGFISPPSLSGIWKCRIVYDKEIEEVGYTPYQMRMVSSLRPVASDTIDYSYKSTNREELNDLFARRGKADDILIVKDGYLTDTSIANIALYMCQFIETIRIEDGQVYNLSYHTARMNRTRAAFWKEAAPIDLSGFISPPSLSGIWKCRIVYDKEIEEVGYTPYQMRMVSSLRPVASDTIDYSYKSTNREELNDLFARRGKADDILIVKDGYLTDTSIANIALYDGHTWYTPAHPLLQGTKRAELLDNRFIVEKDIRQAQLGDYSHIMLFNAMIDWKRLIIPVNEKYFIL